jgi:hypothetical protein
MSLIQIDKVILKSGDWVDAKKYSSEDHNNMKLTRELLALDVFGLCLDCVILSMHFLKPLKIIILISMDHNLLNHIGVILY